MDIGREIKFILFEEEKDEHPNDNEKVNNFIFNEV